jgi:hypothetical protein
MHTESNKWLIVTTLSKSRPIELRISSVNNEIAFSLSSAGSPFQKFNWSHNLNCFQSISCSLLTFISFLSEQEKSAFQELPVLSVRIHKTIQRIKQTSSVVWQRICSNMFLESTLTHGRAFQSAAVTSSRSCKWSVLPNLLTGSLVLLDFVSK